MDTGAGRDSEPPGTRNSELGTLVVQTAYLGDVVLTLPLMRRLAARFGPVDVVATPAAIPMLTGQPDVRRAIAYDKRGTDRGWAGLSRLAGVLRQRRYARAYLPHRSLRSALLARLAGIPERIGFAGGLSAVWHTARVERPAAGHETARLASLAGPGAPIAAPWFALTVEDRRAAATWLAARGLHGEFAVLAPGARWATKRWPHFPALASSLPLPVVAIGGAEDRPMGAAIEAAAPGRAHSAAGTLALAVSAALIARSTLVVSNDSVALHLAGALARPVVAVAGPTGPAPGFEPFSAADSVVGHSDLSCRPCSLHGHARCPLGHHRCMTELGAEQVMAAVLARLERIRGNPGPEERGPEVAASQ